MDYVILKKYDNSHYVPYKTSNMSLFRLADFLCSEVRFIIDADASAYKQWISRDDDWIGGNLSYLRKSEEQPGVIIIGDNTAHFSEDEKDEIIFETNAKELAGILERWAELCRELPKEILILRENGKITLEAVQ